MTCLRCSTSKWALLLTALALAGCHAQNKPVRLQSVYADLNVLVKSDPGWQGIALYDRMQGRLRRSVTQARAGLYEPVPAMHLAALSGLDLPGGAFALPQATLTQQRRLLALLEATQVARLQARRAQARTQQVHAQQAVWRREAQLQYQQAVAAAQQRFSSAYADAVAADSARRLNLTLQIQALTKTITQWSRSVPPTPRLDLARKQLSARQAELADLEAHRTGAIAALLHTRATDIAQAAAASARYVQQQQADLEARLQAQDAAVIAQQRTLLAHQTDALLSRERKLVAAAVPTAGTLGPVTLMAAQPTLPTMALNQAEARLQAQRARWKQGVYEETRAAAQDAARQRGWKVDFVPGRSGEPDRTAQLAVLMASRVWRS